MSMTAEQEAALRANTTTGDPFDVHSASVAAWRNVWALVDEARASLETEREMRQALEVSQANLVAIARGGDVSLPVTGVCVEVRDRLVDERQHVLVTLHALAGCVEWMGEDGCDCGSDDPRCALCEAQAVMEKCADRRAAEVMPSSKRSDGGPFGKWEIEPAATSDVDLTYTNDDNTAFDIAIKVLERILDDIEPGTTRSLHVTLNEVGSE